MNIKTLEKYLQIKVIQKLIKMNPLLKRNKIKYRLLNEKGKVVDTFRTLSLCRMWKKKLEFSTEEKYEIGYI